MRTDDGEQSCVIEGKGHAFWAQGLGAAQAVWLLAQLGDEANLIEVAVSELVVTKAVSDGFQAKVEELCPDCTLTTLEVQLADYGPAMQEKIATASTRNAAW